MEAGGEKEGVGEEEGGLVLKTRRKDIRFPPVLPHVPRGQAGREVEKSGGGGKGK